ncbi:hypothetical protein [Aequorivita xiaoshiensis]|uniref:DUF4382 domain-containing protein n=1 Tax=Aequorivita xiaoshiensis TaxID=2874476 RepID=A0A9X1R1B4_9FLAO|nr:hypothetical protein [Aequorivita xiaoshiensis]MCG2429728.1 hypothetical protein [Aequorivita xiaoshiensis]
MKSLFKLRLIAMLFVGLASCSIDDDSNPSIYEGNAKLVLRLTDAPGDYEAVFVDVEQGEVTNMGVINL